MRKENKIIPGDLCLIIFLSCLLISFSGCVGNNISAAKEIDTSASLFNNAEERYGKASDLLQKGSYSYAKTSLEASKTNYEEALKILENATTVYEEEQQAIDYYTALSSCGLDRVAFLEDDIAGVEHFEKAIAYMGSNDFESVRRETSMAEKSLNDSLVHLKSARAKLDRIEPEMVPVEDKSIIVMAKKDLEQSEKMAIELGEVISGLYPIVDGSEHLMNASELIENKKWNMAAIEVQSTSSNYSASVEKYEVLKDSEFPEISITAIKIYGYLTQMEELLLHLENGCNYAEKGRYNQAINEFNLASAKIGTIAYL